MGSVVVPTDTQWLEYLLHHKKEIRWLQRNGGGFVALHAGITFNLVGSEKTRVYLSISEGFETYSISEPMPMEAAPIGRFANWFRTKVLQQSPKENPPAVIKSLELKTLLNQLVVHALEQCVKRTEDASYARKLNARLWYLATEDFPHK